MFTNANDIKSAVDAGRKVHWCNDGYEVWRSNQGEYYVTFISNGSTIGLTWRDGVTLNGNLEDFYIGVQNESS